MKQVREEIDVSMPRLRPIGIAVSTCVATRPRHAFAVHPWHGSLTTTMPSLGEGYGESSKAILANGTRRLKEPST